MTAETEIPPREELAEMFLADKDDLGPEAFPALRGISSGFMYQFIPEPETPKPPEYVYVPMSRPETTNRLDMLDPASPVCAQMMLFSPTTQAWPT